MTVFEREKYFVVDLLNSRLRVCLKGKTGALESHDYSLDKGDAVHQELMEFVAAIVTGKAPSVKGDDGLRALQLANAITAHIAQPTDT